MVSYLKVPDEWADAFDEIAKEEGITTRGKWAVIARKALKKYLDDEGVDTHLQDSGKEADAAMVEGTKTRAVPAEG